MSGLGMRAAYILAGTSKRKLATCRDVAYLADLIARLQFGEATKRAQARKELIKLVETGAAEMRQAESGQRNLL